MSTSADALKIVQSLVRRSRSARIPYPTLLAYAEKYLAREAEQDPSLEDFAGNPANLLTAYLVDLERQGAVSLTYAEGSVASVYFPEYYGEVLRSLYDRIDESPDTPFPTEESARMPIPSDLVNVVDVKNDLVHWIARASDGPRAEILRVVFPEGIQSLVVTGDLLATRLPKLAIHKFRHYLRNEKNAGYIRSKLAAVFRSREMAMKDMIASILAAPDAAFKTILNPTDFSFQFWTQLSTTIIKEYTQKKEKLPEEQGYCQAAYLLGYYNVYHRGVLQRNRDREAALRTLDSRLRKPPYTFTIGEIHAFTDSHGVPLTKNCSLDDVNRFITERVKPGDDQSLPRMIRVKTGGGKEYYVLRDFVLNVVLERIFAARREFRDHYVDSWSDALKRNRRVSEMTDDLAFDRQVENRLKELDALLHAMLNYNLLYLTRREVNVPSDVAAELDEVFQPGEQRLRPHAEILNLERKQLVTDARLLLPFWQAIPLINALVTFLRRVFIGASEEERAARMERRGVARPRGQTTLRVAAEGPSGAGATAASTTLADTPRALPESGDKRARLNRFKDAARRLQGDYVLPGSTPERTLSELADRWNPLLDPVAKHNLVEDVNSLARDFLRRMKVTFRLIPPTRERVHEWADRLCENEAFGKIRRHDDLKEYLKLYMLTVLGK